MRGRISADGLDDALSALNRLSGDLPGRALVDALNHTGYQARIALHSEMADVFKSPTPWTLKSVQLQEAKAKAARPEAALWINDYPVTKDLAPDRWLRAQVFGGPRVDKGMERLLRYWGILPAGRFVVPGVGARLDQYGNISQGHIMEIKSGLKIAETYGGFTANASRSKRSESKGHERAFFVVKRGRTPIGIGERRVTGIGNHGKWVMVLAFVRQPVYSVKLPFHEIVDRVAADGLETNINTAITKALNGTLGKGYRRAR